MRDGVAYGGNTSVIYRNGIPYVSQGVPDYRIIPKTITMNGTYDPAQDNCDGYSNLTINVPTSDPPVLTTKSITSNGTYNASTDNADGYSQVTVNVNQATETKSITSNGTYTPSSGKIGFSSVTVNVNQSTETKSITANGTYTPSSGKIGFSSVTVNVPSMVTISGVSFTWRTSAGWLISKSLSGYSYVVLKCKTSGHLDSYKKHVYICMPTNGEVVYGGWMCTHDQGSGPIYGNCAGTFHATTSGVYMDSFNNSDSRTSPYQSLNFVALYGIK